jgi:hypothetical protein
MTTYGVMEVYVLTFLNCAMEVSGQLHAPTALPRRNSLGIRGTGGMVDPRAGSDVVSKIRVPPGNQILTIQPVISRYTDRCHRFTYLIKRDIPKSYLPRKCEVGVKVEEA